MSQRLFFWIDSPMVRKQTPCDISHRLCVVDLGEVAKATAEYFEKKMK